MAYAQWATFDIDVKGFTVVIQAAHLSWGKFYELDNKDKEINASKINGKVIDHDTSDKDRIISTCGRSDAASGTEGSFEIYLYDPTTKKASAKLAVISWDCPWGSKKNVFTASAENKNYLVSHSHTNLDSGALGNITIKIREFDE